MNETTIDVSTLRALDLDRLDRALARRALAATPGDRRLLDFAITSLYQDCRRDGLFGEARELIRFHRAVTAAA